MAKGIETMGIMLDVTAKVKPDLSFLVQATRQQVADSMGIHDDESIGDLLTDFWVIPR